MIGNAVLDSALSTLQDIIYLFYSTPDYRIIPVNHSHALDSNISFCLTKCISIGGN